MFPDLMRRQIVLTLLITIRTLKLLWQVQFLHECMRFWILEYKSLKITSYCLSTVGTKQSAKGSNSNQKLQSCPRGFTRHLFHIWMNLRINILCRRLCFCLIIKITPKQAETECYLPLTCWSHFSCVCIYLFPGSRGFTHSSCVLTVGRLGRSITWCLVSCFQRTSPMGCCSGRCDRNITRTLLTH